MTCFSFLNDQGASINYASKILPIFDPPSSLRKQVYHISLCSSISIWLTPSPWPAYVVYGCPLMVSYSIGVFRQVNYEHLRPIYLAQAKSEAAADGTAQPPTLKTTLTASFDLPSLDQDQGPLIFQPSQTTHCCRSLPGLIIFTTLSHGVLSRYYHNKCY